MALINPWSERAIWSRRRKRRKREVELMLQSGEIQPGARILDIGCGDAYQCSILRSMGYNVVCTDILNYASYTDLDVRSDCTYLPFKDNSFDVVYSGNLLEHIEDKSHALQEMARVLDPNGSIYAIVPTWIWKMGQMLTYYPLLMARFVERISRTERRNLAMKTKTPKNVGKFKGLCLKAKQICYPEVHGTYLSNSEELRAFRTSSWLKLFRSNGLNVTKVVAGPLSVPSEFPLPAINASRLGICSTIIVVLGSGQVRGEQE